MGTAQWSLDVRVSFQVGSTRNPIDIHLGASRVVVFRITQAIWRLCRSMRVSNVTLEEMLVTVGLAAPFVSVGTHKITFAEVRDIIVCRKCLFLFNS